MWDLILQGYQFDLKFYTLLRIGGFRLTSCRRTNQTLVEHEIF